jgi:hypothetical protein
MLRWLYWIIAILTALIWAAVLTFTNRDGAG